MSKVIHIIEVVQSQSTDSQGNVSYQQAKIGVMLPDSYSEVEDVVGVVKAEQGEGFAMVATVRQLRRSGVVIALKARVDINGTIKPRTILCDIDKVATARGGLLGKQFGGGTIQSVSIPMRRRLK